MRRKRPGRLAVASGAALSAALVLTLGSAEASAAVPATALPAAAAIAPGMPVAGVFGPASVYRQQVVSAPVAANSAAMVRDLVGVVSDRYGGVAAFNAHSYTNSFATAAAGTPRIDVAFDDCQHKGYLPAGLTGAGGQLTGVPIPAGAVPANGTDNELSVWSPGTDQLWELWEAKHTAAGWSACWGGRIDHVSAAVGFFAGGFGASASGLAISGGTLGVAEVRAGVVDHALNLAIPDTYGWQTWSWPAQRSDGGNGSNPNAIPEGTRLRLDPRLDVDALPGLTPIARLVAHTAQTYGFVVSDSAGAVAVTGESGAAEQQATGVDPWLALDHGVPDYAMLAHFPWSSLQAMPKDWGKGATATVAAPAPAAHAPASPGLVSCQGPVGMFRALTRAVWSSAVGQSSGWRRQWTAVRSCSRS